MAEQPGASLLGAGEVRQLATRLGVRPAKRWGQNFVVDANTVRRIVAAADVAPTDVVVEVGPGLGSLTLGLLDAAAVVYAVEVDPALAAALPGTVAQHAPAVADRLVVVTADAMTVVDLPEPPTALVANLPYNVAVPVVLHLLATFPSIAHGLVMVQAEVADRLTAAPGSRTYGVPSAKLAWFASARRAGSVPPGVFWPVPRVESGLVALERLASPPTVDGVVVDRTQVFAAIDAAFAQRRKTLRAALAGWAGSPSAAEQLCRAAGIDPSLRGEQLSVDAFTRLALARVAAVAPGGAETP